MLEPARIRAPALPGLVWVNGSGPGRLADLTGAAVLLEFLELTCLSCLRVLPYLRQWQASYGPYGLQVLGVHTPEFPFGHQPEVVSLGAKRLGLRFPIAIDNEQTVWTAYAVKAWPTSVLLDPAGYIRLSHTGEHDYAQVEAGIRELLSGRPGFPAEELAPVELAPEHEPGAVCYPVTPEIHAESLGNPTPDGDGRHQLPEARSAGRYYLDGRWRVGDQVVVSTGADARLFVPYQAADVYAVLESQTADQTPIDVGLSQAGASLPAGSLGGDVAQRQGRAVLRVDGPRLYHVAKHGSPAGGELVLEPDRPGLAVYAFQFGSCLMPATPSG